MSETNDMEDVVAQVEAAGEHEEGEQQQQKKTKRELQLDLSQELEVASDMASRIEYSEKYMDDRFEYRHVILPKTLAEALPNTRLLQENEWRGIGVQQSRGWTHYAVHK
jgi:cyclin-dependent kinase regulatory subunit CKS1